MNTLYYNECVQYAFKHKNIKAKSLEEAGLRIYKRLDFNPQAIFSAVGKGGIVMPIVSGHFFDDEAKGLVYTVIVAVNKVTNLITLFNPFENDAFNYDLNQFLQLWIADGSDCITAFHFDEKTYHPVPTDLSNITLSDDLIALRERLAENAHDVWAIERQSEGWSYGPKRDDHKLETPDMLPYTQLPETEKEYDRVMVDKTLRLLVAYGYTISK